MPASSRRRLERALGVPDAVVDPSTRREAAATNALNAPGVDDHPDGRRSLKLGVAEGCVEALVRAQDDGETDRFLAGLEPLDEGASRLAKSVETADVRPTTAERTEGAGVDALDVPIDLLTGLMREMLQRLLEHVRERPIEADEPGSTE